MAKSKIKLNSSEVRRVLKSREIQADLVSRAERVAAVAGSGFEVRTNIGPNRARAAVVAVSSKAQRAEAKSGALSKALDAGRG
ncbi:MAG: hypothetical protein ABS910_05830 [Arthrobacter sp.]